jgi:hypothetical protein
MHNSGAKSILSFLTLIAEKNVLLRKRSFAFLHSQGHFQTSNRARVESVRPSTTDVRPQHRQVRKVPILLKKSLPSTNGIFQDRWCVLRAAT